MVSGEGGELVASESAWLMERKGKRVRVLTTAGDRIDGILDDLETDGIIVDGKWLNRAQVVEIRDSGEGSGISGVNV